MRKVRLLFCLVGILLSLWRCEGGKESIRSTLLAIKGKVFLNGVNPCCNLDRCSTWWVNCPEGDAAGCSVMTPYQGVKVSVFFKRILVEKTYTDGNGNFLIKIPPGIYDVKIYPPHNLIDTHADVKVLNFQDTDLGKLFYAHKFPPQELSVWYHPDVSKQRLEEIMEETGNTIIRCGILLPFVVIEVPGEYHPQEMIEILETNHPQEIRYASLPIIYCLE